MAEAHMLAVHRKGGLAHALSSTSKGDLGVAMLDLLGGGDDSLEAAAAQAVDGESNGVHMGTRAERDVTREVCGVGRCLGDVAKYGSVDQLGVELQRRRAQQFEKSLYLCRITAQRRYKLSADNQICRDDRKTTTTPTVP